MCDKITISEYRKIVDEVLETYNEINFMKEKDSFFIQNENLLVGAVRVQTKYSSLFQEVDYWLCAGHTFITICDQRDKDVSDDYFLYPFRIPWDSALSVTAESLIYDPMSWDSRCYDFFRVEYGKSSIDSMKTDISYIVDRVIAAANQLKSLTIKEALEKIEKDNGDVWVGKEYIKSYKRQIS